MAEFKKITPFELAENPFKLIGQDWMLVSSANPEGEVGGRDYNTMTASWGGVGILWKKPVVYVFIRPQRHTFGFSEANDRMTLSFFDEDYRPALAFCGKESGRDYDKAKECGLTPVFDSNENGRAVWFDEAKLVIKVKKLYADWIKKDAFTDESPLTTYAAGDFHKMYVCQIEEVLVK
ncbi:MAG: flavin reductase family protein [Ruminococcaceae bacterium]|nr:flavin reductase family protein [Oscillospiraceae bacterium]